METTNTTEMDYSIEDYRETVIDLIQADTPDNEIIKHIVDSGGDANSAQILVTETRKDMAAVQEAEKLTFMSLLPALVGGLIAAIIGGTIWGLIAIATDREVGYIAIGLGLLCGFAVVLLSRGKKGPLLQFIAVVASLMGIVIGKYVLFQYIVVESVKTEQGIEVASEIPYVSLNLIVYFGQNLVGMLGPYDILWAILAIVAALKIPAPSYK